MADAVEWIELKQIMQDRYPDLSLHEAYVNLLHDSFVKLPKKVAETMIPILPHLARLSPETVEAFGTLYGAPYLTFFARMTGIIRNTTTDMLKPKADNISAYNSHTLGLATMMKTGMLERAISAAKATSNTGPSSFESMAANARLTTDNIGRIANSADGVVRKVHGIHTQTVAAIQIAQGHQAIVALNKISDHLGETNNITVSGSGGPDGFARHVYDFIRHGIDEAEGDNHRFFVYNPDTDWYPAFSRLIREDPLPPTFCAKSENLDTICQYMQGVRAELNAESECGKDTVFHLLIPLWYRISIKEPLHFPDCLQPFQVEGRKHKGHPLVEFNLPAAPAGLLYSVENVLDPNNLNKIAQGASIAITLPTVGWGINGACLALGFDLGAITGLGPLVAIPTWYGSAILTMGKAVPLIDQVIYNALCEEAPRVLGSNQRFGMAS